MNTVIAKPISSSRAGRLWCYISEMFPLHVRVPINILNFGFIYLGLQAIAGFQPVRFSWITLIGAITVQLLWLFIRVYDELKDSESDVAFARAGDKRFQNRPLVTGRVKLEDIAALRWWLTAAVFAINLPLGFPVLFIGFLIAFGYLTLAYKWFFWPELRNHIILVFFTHIPNVLVIQIYSAAAFVAQYGFTDTTLTCVLLLALWMTAAAFEFSYKIRIPADETVFATYSKVLGAKVATGITMLFLLIAIVCTLLVCWDTSLPPVVPVIVATVGAWAFAGCMLFLLAPTRERANLTKYIGVYWYVSCISLVAGIILQRGAAFV